METGTQAKTDLQNTGFYHLHFNNLITSEALDICSGYMDGEGGGNTLFFINAHCFNLTFKDKDYVDQVRKASLIFNDGIGIKIAAALKRISIRENMNGTDFIPRLLGLAQKENRKVFLVGSEPDVIGDTYQNLLEKYPGINIVGYSDGFFSKRENGENELIAKVNETNPDIMIVGMGVPYQEKWVMRNKHKMNSVKLFVAGGAILDFMAGKFPRAPMFVRKIGLEWFWRFMQEPRRLFKRYFLGNFRFFYLVLKSFFRS